MSGDSNESAVLAANEAFYAAFAGRDMVAMEALWAQHTAVGCIHPGWPPLTGRDRVMESWRAILGNADAPQIRCAEPVVHILADLAVVICLEIVDGGLLAATNLFVREGDAWLIAHHHAGPTASTSAGDAPGSGDTLH